jgi:hypothetical protein
MSERQRAPFAHAAFAVDPDESNRLPEPSPLVRSCCRDRDQKVTKPVCWNTLRHKTRCAAITAFVWSHLTLDVLTVY